MIVAVTGGDAAQMVNYELDEGLLHMWRIGNAEFLMSFLIVKRYWFIVKYGKGNGAVFTYNLYTVRSC